MFTESPQLNLLWAKLLIEELLRNGVAGFCVSPGSRSTPLAVAIANTDRATHRTHFDERGAAFHALGWAKSTKRPVALVCTSGSAVANYWPAIVEAAAARVPLIIITADRPPELLHCGANQAIEQTGIFGSYVRWAFTLPCPDIAIAPSMVLTTAAQAVYRAQRSPAGPVHLNCMFREPLSASGDSPEYPPEYLADLASWQRQETPFTRWNTPEDRLTTAQDLDVINRIGRVQQGLLIVGELGGEPEMRAADKLAQSLAWPVFADVTSGLRLGLRNPFIAHYFDQMLLSDKFNRYCAPEFVLHIGGPITSKRLIQHLEQGRPEYMLVADHPLRQDPAHLVSHRFETHLAEFCRWLEPSVRDRGVKPWCLEACRLSQETGAIIDEWLAERKELSEIFVARTVSRLRTEGSVLFLGNSMPVRDMDMFGADDGPWGWTAANRGASGIDGNIATAAGYAQGLNAPVTALLGDLTTLHDLNSLSLLRDAPAPVLLIILNNNGGGIFSFLPVAGHTDAFESHFAMPHDLGFEYAAALFGLPYFRPQTPAEFKTVYAQALENAQSAIIEVVTDRTENLQLHRALQARIAQQIDERLA